MQREVHVNAWQEQGAHMPFTAARTSLIDIAQQRERQQPLGG
jgi:hypothetical protein